VEGGLYAVGSRGVTGQMSQFALFVAVSGFAALLNIASRIVLSAVTSYGVIDCRLPPQWQTYKPEQMAKIDQFMAGRKIIFRMNIAGLPRLSNFVWKKKN
jgi:hypothetical protein